ncbi:MAG: MBL fold metallo-hydrolase [Eubacterium ramulus]
MDPGRCSQKESEKKCAKCRADLLAILLTHGHFDHILAAEEDS